MDASKVIRHDGSLQKRIEKRARVILNWDDNATQWNRCQVSSAVTRLKIAHGEKILNDLENFMEEAARHSMPLRKVAETLDHDLRGAAKNQFIPRVKGFINYYDYQKKLACEILGETPKRHAL